jgi:hypothetical protein
MRPIQDYTYLEVIRSVKDVGTFLDRARTIAGLIFQKEQPETLLDIPASLVDGSEGSLVIGAPGQLFKIYDGDAVRLPLYERKSLPSLSADRSFSHLAEKLRDGKIDTTKNEHRNVRKGKSYQVEPLLRQLYQIQLRHDFPNEDCSPVKLNNIDFRFAEDLTNGDIELTLLPDISDRATAMLTEQSKRCGRVVAQLAQRVAYPNSYQRLEVPFARIPVGTASDQLNTFIKQVKDNILPIDVNLSKPKIRFHSSS